MPEPPPSPRAPHIQDLNLKVVYGFRNRTGWCVIAQLEEPGGQNIRDYELTKQYNEPHDAVQALAGFLRTQIVETEEP